MFVNMLVNYCKPLSSEDVHINMHVYSKASIPLAGNTIQNHMLVMLMCFHGYIKVYINLLYTYSHLELFI